MARYLADASLPNESYAAGRCGNEVRSIIAAARKKDSNPPVNTQRYALKKVKMLPGIALVLALARMIYWMLRKPVDGKERLLKQLLGSEYEILQAGRFRLGGEIHQWMYDSYSLGRLLTACGFRSVTIRSASESYIPGWPGYNLDTEPDGSVYKPDSLFIEALR